MLINYILDFVLGRPSPLILLPFFILKAIDLPIYIVVFISPIDLIYIEFVLFINSSFL